MSYYPTADRIERVLKTTKPESRQNLKSLEARKGSKSLHGSSFTVRILPNRFSRPAIDSKTHCCPFQRIAAYCRVRHKVAGPLEADSRDQRTPVTVAIRITGEAGRAKRGSKGQHITRTVHDCSQRSELQWDWHAVRRDQRVRSWTRVVAFERHRDRSSLHREQRPWLPFVTPASINCRGVARRQTRDRGPFNAQTIGLPA